MVDHPIEFPMNKKGSPKDYRDLMDIKEEKKRREEREKPLFFFLSLSFVLAMVILVFEYKSTDAIAIITLDQGTTDIELLTEVPPTEQPPPPPPQQAIPEIITSVADDVEIIEDLKIQLDMEVTEDTRVDEIVYEEVVVEIEEEKVEEVFSFVEDLPEPIGGFQVFYDYLSQNIEYPTRALKQGVGGRVFVQFVVEKDGSLTNFIVVKGIGLGCDDEAVRVLASAPKWKAGKQRGIPVRVYKTIPVYFKIKG